MSRNDWVGLGVSLAVHLVLVIAFGLMTLAASEPITLGYIEVELGPISEGRPVRKAVENEPAVPEPKKESREQPQPKKPAAAPPKEAKPVNLPKQPEQVVDEERVQSPDTDVISPEQQNSEATVTKPEPEPEQPEVAPVGGGAADGTSGAAEGTDGPGTEERRSAPYNIEGLNRRPTTTRLPAYAEKVNAIIRVRITVDPQGRVIQRIPLMKANPALEQAVMSALQYWRFNPLPPNAPQENQTGTITFRFRLE